MYFEKISLLFVVATTLQLIGLPCSTTAEKVVLDIHSDTLKNWLEVTCLYNDDYNDFWVYGYPVTLSGYSDIFPQVRGYWTAGPAQHCELHYFGGSQMPVPKSLSLSVFIKGKPQLLVSSKFNFWEEEYTDEVGMVSDRDGWGWIEKTFDLSKQRGLAFNFTLISMGEDVILLDKITFDLGDDVTTPTEPPPPTTVRPIDGQNTVVLDTSADYWLLWEESCHYIDDYAYLWAFGCPVHEPREESLETVGFWNPCNTNKTKTCTLRFKGNSSLVPLTPDLINIRGYVDGDSKIRVTLQPDHGELCDGEEECWELANLNATDFGQVWGEKEITQERVLPEYTINIELVPSENGVVLLDKVILRQPGYEETSPPPQTGGPSDSTGGPSDSTGGPTDSTGGPPESTTDSTGGPPESTTDSTGGPPESTTDSGVDILKMNWPLMSALIIITSAFLNN